MVVYPRSGQKIFFQRETATYGEPYTSDSSLTAFTIVAANYSHWRRMDLIPDSADIIVPLIEKLKQFDIGDAKHPSAIFSGNIKPVEFTIDMNAQSLEFLAFAIGAPTLTSHKRAMVQTITCPAESGSIAQGDYLLIDAVTSNIIEHFAVWMDTVGDATTGKPTITGIAAANVLAANISVNTPSNTATQVATAVAAIIDADGTFGAASTGAVVTVTHGATGAVQQAFDSGVAPTLCTFAVTTWGSTDYAVIEAVDYNLPSFTIHVEQAHGDTSGEDIVWDLFGCVVQEIAIDVNYGNSIVTASVTFACPYALENSNGICTNPPPRKLIAAFPSMTSLKEATNEALLQEGATCTLNGANDRTPETVDKMSLTIRNNVTFQTDIAKRYGVLAVAGKREISMNIVGATSEKELFTYYQGLYVLSGTDWVPTGASKLNTHIRLERDSTYDYIFLTIYNWVLEEHNFVFVSVDDAVKVVDMTFTDGSSDSNGRLIDDMDFVSYVDSALMVETA